ncbi:unnamed protein product [Gongylonema pulchrum]|uniref:Tudor domain-containing protein n=1 Tax=Gongylonema pulchrum TaxID=637853 RepID=A0A183D1K8_9BILA|nr:unnamed protein product [Gongylonema pulchrum]
MEGFSSLWKEVSPYEFFARPLEIKQRAATDPRAHGGADQLSAGDYVSTLNEMEDAMITANDEFRCFAADLDAFYIHPENRREIEPSQVIASMEKGERLYCIIDVDNDFAACTGRWQRAEILGIKVIFISDVRRTANNESQKCHIGKAVD